MGKQWAGARDDQDQDSHLPIAHLFSCDNAKGMQAWIQKSHSPGILVADIKDAAESLMVFDEKTKQFVRLPHPTALMAGWVCHDATPGRIFAFFLTFVDESPNPLAILTFDITA